jgi:AAA+ ATPase superfamily predicted ATPase
MNPFLLTGYESPDYFCDRVEETKTLLNNLNNRSNTTFFAPRRTGKTALIQHVFHTLKKKKQVCIYIDIYATQNLKDLTNEIATAVYNAMPLKTSWGKGIVEKIKLFRPIISLDEITGNPQVTLDITRQNQIEQTIPQLLELLDSQNIKIAIAIDEFQQILNYPEKNVEAILRTCIQKLKNIHFIFCGSNQKMMHEIFNHAKRPFFASTKSIYLKKINPEIYSAFIKQHFEKNKFKIQTKYINTILILTDNHTYYTQRMCHEIFQLNEKEITPFTILKALRIILNDNEGSYFQYRKLLTGIQWHLLSAIAMEEKIEHPYNQDFIYKYKLGNASGVKRALDALIEKEMIYHDINREKPVYEVYDKFLLRWLQHK